MERMLIMFLSEGRASCMSTTRIGARRTIAATICAELGMTAIDKPKARARIDRSSHWKISLGEYIRGSGVVYSSTRLLVDAVAYRQKRNLRSLDHA